MNRYLLDAAIGWTRRHKGLVALAAIPLLVMALVVFEHVRGSIALARYVKALRARGEKVTAEEFRLRTAQGENGAPEVLAAAQDLKAGAVLPKSYPPRMRLTAAGNAIVGFREEQWVDEKVTNNWNQLEVDLETNAATLNKIRAGMAKPLLDAGIDPSLGPRAYFPHLPVPKALTVWFGSSIALALHEGRCRQASTDLVTEVNLTRLLERDGIVISELVRIAVAAVSRVDTWEALRANGWADEDLAQLQQAWANLGFATNMVRALEGERIFARSAYELMRQSNDETVGTLYGLGAYLPAEDTPHWEQILKCLPGGETAADFLKKQVYCRLWRFAWLDQDELHYLRYLERLIGYASDAAREKSLKKIAPHVEELALEFQNKFFYNRLRYPSVMSVNSLSRVVARAMRAETERSLILTAIALKRYELANNRLPQSLKELVPRFLPSVPIDYMDGQPIRFVLQGDGRFLLYSVGEDGMDDSGDTSPLPGRSNLRNIWDRKDVVWPAAATSAEVQAFRTEAAKE